MVVPEVSPERTYMLGRFPVVLWISPFLKGTDQTEAAPCLHPLTKLRDTSSSGPLAPDQPRVAIYLFTLASMTRQRCPRTRHPIKMVSKNNSNNWVTHTSSGSKKEIGNFSKPTSTPETSHGTHRTSAAGKPEAPTAKTNHLSTRREGLHILQQSPGGERKVNSREKIGRPRPSDGSTLSSWTSASHDIAAQSRTRGRRSDPRRC